MQKAEYKVQNEKNKKCVPRGGSRKELKCIFYVNGERVDRLTEEQKDSMAEKLSKAMSRYYTVNIEEYQTLMQNADP